MATELTGTRDNARAHFGLDATMAALFARSGDSGALIAAHDWPSTALGPISGWPPGLRHALSLCLQSREPTALWWGPDLVMFHNDAYGRTFGSMHPAAIGRRGQECWAENWPTMAPLLFSVLNGAGSVRANDLAVFLDRDGGLEERHFTFSYSPIDELTGGDSAVGGVFASVVETADPVSRSRQALAGRQRIEDRTEIAASMVQHRLLPERLPRADGVTASAAYVAAGLDADVGGDWYELMALDEGRTLVVAIGDIVGRGIGAAAAMSELRNALRLLAAERAGPSEALGRLNHFVHTVASGHFATCWYCCIDRDAMTLTYASAGHLPPLVLAPNGSVRALDAAVGPPIGARRGTTYPEHCVDFSPGSTMLLYTDGLVEHHLAADVDPIERLIQQADTNDPHELVERLVARLPGEDERRDDTALLALRIDDLTNTFHREIPLELTALSRLRHDLRGWLHEQGVERGAEGEIVLGVCEIVTNAIEHAVDPSEPLVVITGRRTAEQIEIAVRDTGHWRSRRNQPERGRGIAIARQLLDVDIERSSTGTTVRLCRRSVPTA